MLCPQRNLQMQFHLLRNGARELGSPADKRLRALLQAGVRVRSSSADHAHVPCCSKYMRLLFV